MSGLAALMIALAIVGGGIEMAAADSYNLSGKWIDTSATTSLLLTQSGNSITWQGGPNNRAWIQNFDGTLTGSWFSSTFWQDEPGRSPQRYHGTMAAHVVDNCHFIFDSIVQTGQATLSNIEFIKTPCAVTTPQPTKSVKPTRIVWPALPDVLVSLASVSNGCGGGPAGTDPQYGDDSEFVDLEIPFADVSAWSTAKKYRVNFRDACNQHDVGYSHAKVKEMTLNGGKVIDYFTWTKKKVDKKFLNDMIKICDAWIPKSATIALNNCKNNGGFHSRQVLSAPGQFRDSRPDHGQSRKAPDWSPCNGLRVRLSQMRQVNSAAQSLVTTQTALFGGFT